MDLSSVTLFTSKSPLNLRNLRLFCGAIIPALRVTESEVGLGLCGIGIYRFFHEIGVRKSEGKSVGEGENGREAREEEMRRFSRE
jgi:hypothetical protein